jgi:hypothetical protein
MQDGLRTATSLSSNGHEVELSYISTITNNHNISSNRSLFRGKSNSIKNRFEKILKKIDCLNIEERGIERVSPEDRTDLTIINTGMIWVRKIY